MSLIKCPECQLEISDKAIECPNCGYILKKNPITKVCEECGVNLVEGVKICPQCGCPVPESEEEKKRKNRKRIFIIVSAFVGVILVISLIISISIISKHKKEKEEAAAKKEAMIQALNDYSKNLSLASLSMLGGASTAEEAGKLIRDVWHDAIFHENNANTSKYTSGISDFNDSLTKLFADQEFKNTIASIKENQGKVKEIMQKLKNPPSEYEEAYRAINEYYDAYLALTNLVINPTGSFLSYSESFNEADSNVVKRYQAMDIYLE